MDGDFKCEKISTDPRCCLSADQIQKLFALLKKEHPNAKSELNFNNLFELLCAVILSAQATDVSVNKVTPLLFAKAPDAGAMARLGEDNIAKIIKSIGLWRTKAKNLALTAEYLLKYHQGRVPDDYDALIKLPGVGSKTARVVLNVGFNKPFIAVDTHIFRVCNRTGLCLGKSVKEVEDNLPDYVPSEYLQKAHHYLLLHGRYVCMARKPDCSNCTIAHICKNLPFHKPH